jgi:hypothetical protein
MKICLPLRFGSVCGTSGTIAQKSTVEESISGRNNSILAAMFAPLEYPTAIICCKSKL